MYTGGNPRIWALETALSVGPCNPDTLPCAEWIVGLLCSAESITDMGRLIASAAKMAEGSGTTALRKHTADLVKWSCITTRPIMTLGAVE